MFRPHLRASSKAFQVVFVHWSIIEHYFWYPVLVVLLPLNSVDKKSLLFCSYLCIKGMLADRNKLLCVSRCIPVFTLARPFQLCCQGTDEILRCKPHHLVPHQDTYKEYSRLRHNMGLEGHLHAPANWPTQMTERWMACSVWPGAGPVPVLNWSVQRRSWTCLVVPVQQI